MQNDSHALRASSFGRSSSATDRRISRLQWASEGSTELLFRAGRAQQLAPIVLPTRAGREGLLGSWLGEYVPSR